MRLLPGHLKSAAMEERMMLVTKRLAVAALLSGALVGVSAWCSRADAKEALGSAAVTGGYAATTIQDLVKMDRLKDQKVLFEAVVSKVGCQACGGVIVADKTWRISVCPEDPAQLKIPTRAGTRLRIWGTLTIVNDFREVKAERVERL